MTLQMLQILSQLSNDPERGWYGLQLSKQSGLKPGTIYPILDRLLKAGWVEREWEEIDPRREGRPKRRLYRLTRIGEVAAREALEDHVSSLRRQSLTVGPKPQLGLS